jgi:hypothetical protein
MRRPSGAAACLAPTGRSCRKGRCRGIGPVEAHTLDRRDRGVARRIPRIAEDRGQLGFERRPVRRGAGAGRGSRIVAVDL